MERYTVEHLNFTR